MMTPMIQMAAIKPNDKNIITVIIPLGANLIKNTYNNPTTIEIMVQTMMGAMTGLPSN
jgi:hypothetical protein